MTGLKLDKAFFFSVTVLLIAVILPTIRENKWGRDERTEHA